MVKNIIFDLGGVLLNLNYQLTIDAFKSLGIANFEELYTQAQQSSLFDDIETGKISADEFLEGVSEYLPETVTHAQIIEAWNAMLLDLPKERLDFLTEMKANYRTALLSNTNTIHLDSFHKQLKQDHGLDSLDEFFHTVYFSCDMNMRKPYPEIFLEVCEKEGFKPEETLFIDDTMQHVEGAKKAGLQALYLDVKKENVIQLLRAFLA